MEETELPGFDGNSQTFVCSNVCFDQILQVFYILLWTMKVKKKLLSFEFYKKKKEREIIVQF